jgi:hypothetical protein
MRLGVHTAVPAAIAFVGLVSALSAPASATEADPASAVRGSLGASLDELVFSSSAGATVFFLNAGFVLLFAAICIAARRADTRKRWRIPFRTASKFAR